MRGHVLTRDSAVWAWGIVAAVVLGLATLGPGDPANPLSLGYYGIPDGAAPYIRLAALLIGIISGALKTSPLPGENDAKVRAIRDGR